ncbi:MAG: hypothetical protein HC918_12230 [Oscillatoriales cyanobacterium SM2_1_8]|nr:hypothetical protein [Oscillatoriales cyanobacterium SM2_1_8]
MSYPTVRQTLLVPFAGLLAITAALIGGVSLESGRQSAKGLARKLAGEATERVQSELRQFLQVPHHANAATVAVMAASQGETRNPRTYRDFYWQAMADFPSVNVVGFGRGRGRVRRHCARSPRWAMDLLLRVCRSGGNRGFCDLGTGWGRARSPVV